MKTLEMSRGLINPKYPSNSCYSVLIIWYTNIKTSNLHATLADNLTLQAFIFPLYIFPVYVCSDLFSSSFCCGVLKRIIKKRFTCYKALSNYCNKILTFIRFNRIAIFYIYKFYTTLCCYKSYQNIKT